MTTPFAPDQGDLVTAAHPGPPDLSWKDLTALTPEEQIRAYCLNLARVDLADPDQPPPPWEEVAAAAAGYLRFIRSGQEPEAPRE
ncbi:MULTISPECIES: hypothetical protein [Frankia]|uniref:Uncharacterized protein n=1 Tax=Frankia alni (strain DSM 45986 / CECT 9034 / ACN14a) TaxID=326424 RepID=Q0RMB1_FRAAA|nr:MULTISPECIES: hypothetical protein [Frankia]CAJ61340.1 hypothetical protein FRAAL2694 [Frankia alni ACN14a]